MGNQCSIQVEYPCFLADNYKYNASVKLCNVDGLLASKDSHENKAPRN